MPNLDSNSALKVKIMLGENMEKVLREYRATKNKPFSGHRLAPFLRRHFSIRQTPATLVTDFSFNRYPHLKIADILETLAVELGYEERAGSKIFEGI